MNQNTLYPKVARDIFVAQSLWTIGFLAVVFLVHLVHIFFALFNDRDLGTFFDTIFISGNIYMFIIGIIATFFLPHFVSYGVTRKDSYIGTLIGASALSIAIPIITLIVSSIVRWIVLTFSSISFSPSDINSIILETDPDRNLLGNIISYTVQSFIAAPYVDPTSNWFLAIIITAMNFFGYYVLGWMIGSAFYRFRTPIGLAFIVIGLVLLIAKNALLRIPLDLPLPEYQQFIAMIPKSLAAMMIVLLISLMIALIRMMTKRVTIKM